MIDDFHSNSNEQDSSASDLLKTDDFSTTIDDLANNSNDFFRPSQFGISCFPAKVDFNPIYPNSISHQKLLVINTGIKSEYISIKIEGNQFPFTINATGATIEPNASKSIIISYRPLKSREYSTNLIVEGREKLIVPISGSCLQSPIEIPSELDPVWSTFSKRHLSSYIPIKNKSKKETFHIEFSTNCPSIFKVYPEMINIEPDSSEHVTIKYTPNQDIEKIPHFHMKCEVTGDLITRILKVVSLMFINFGPIIVGKSTKKKADFIHFNEVPEVKPPFSATIANDLFFIFQPTEGGTFRETLQIADNQIELIGEGIEMPFLFNPENFKVQNITNDTISLSFSLDTKATIIPQKSEIQSKAWTFLNFEKGNASVLFITYHRNEDEEFTWQFELPKRIESPCKMTQVDQSLFEPKQDTLFPESDLIVTHPSFISFFQSRTEATFIVTGVDHFEADGPIWLRFPKDVEVDSPIDIELKNNVFYNECEVRTISDKIVIQSEISLPHELPIIGYKGQSDISCVEKSVLTYALDDHYITQIEVKNCGDIPGFAIFTASDKTKNNVRIYPSAAIIDPDCTQIFEFIVDSKPQPGLSVPIVLYSCDEILRQIRALLYSEDFFCSDVPIDANEVIEMKSVFNGNSIKKKEFNSIFKKLLHSKEIELYTFERTSEKRLAIFPLQIEAFPNDSSKFSIINMSSTTIAAQIHSRNRVIVVNPTNAIIKGYSEVSINVKLLTEVNSSIYIEYEDDTIEVPVKSISEQLKDFTPAVKKKVKMIKIEPKFLDFGICYVDQPSRKANVKVTNLTHKKLCVTVQPRCRNWKFPSKPFTYPASLKLPPFSTSEFIVEFSPSTAFKFEETVFVETENESECHKIRISGNGISKKHDNFIGTEADNLSFPPCELGRIQRGRIRIMNQRDQKCNIIASAQFPFICPVPRFSIEPNCYVLCPIHFSPKTEGKFTGFATFESDISDTFKIKVNGIAILPN
ncbi:hypothetical protein M9Y10_020070 [Tritrichomonas musculus]|uniref:Cep192-like domain-containing protein n=1 Tax=Tritrichomonas musculus TaxID=1915356 RepID=A0ABR2HGC8_9EUKA